jgi:hypothetical protein
MIPLPHVNGFVSVHPGVITAIAIKIKDIPDTTNF